MLFIDHDRKGYVSICLACTINVDPYCMKFVVVMTCEHYFNVVRVADLEASTGGFDNLRKLCAGIYRQDKIDGATIVVANQINSIIGLHELDYISFTNERFNVFYRKSATYDEFLTVLFSTSI